MSDVPQDELARLSDVLAARTAVALRHLAVLGVAGAGPLTATLWRAGVAIASDQCFPEARDAELVLPDGRSVAARVAGRDPSTNVVALRFDDGTGLSASAAEPRLGAPLISLRRSLRC